MDWLAYNGYNVCTKDVKVFYNDGDKVTKGNMDVEIVVECIRAIGYMDRCVLFSGDGDFTALVVFLQQHGIHVTVVSSIHTKPSMLADELRRVADSVIDLQDLIPHIATQRDEG